MKRKKSYIILAISILIAVSSVSYAWFSAVITGNDTAKKNTVVTGVLKLTYTDTNEMSLSNAFPGDSFTKVISVKNTGTVNLNYNLIWQELNNGITNNELVIEATCKRLNSSNTEEGTCEGISESAVNSVIIKNDVLIEPKVTHEYTLKVTFKDTGLPQNYNKNKTFTGKLGIEEVISTPFREESWSTIAANVRAGNISGYNVGDTREIDLGSYGIHRVRIANLSTPSECKTEGFSQSACGFVVEFENIIMMSVMNNTDTSKGGWPASKVYSLLNTDLYNALPSDLKSLIIDTTVVSGHGSSDSANFTSIDKFYLLSGKEVYSDFSSTYDTGKDLTRTLDYYVNKGVTTSSYSEAIKKYGTTASWWWLRAAYSSSAYIFFAVNDNGIWGYYGAYSNYGVSPAFRIG